MHVWKVCSICVRLRKSKHVRIGANVHTRVYSYLQNTARCPSFSVCVHVRMDACIFTYVLLSLFMCKLAS